MFKNKRDKKQTASAFGKIIGYEGIKEELLRICDSLKYPEKYRELGAVPPRGVILYGEPGLGKTEMAKCFIAESGRKSFIIRKNKFDGKFIDYIKEVFDRARAEAPSVVFLDDLDKFANDPMDEGAEEYAAVQAGIDECRDFEVFVIATANKICYFPDSLIRAGRLETKLRFYLPKQADSTRIVEYYLRGKLLAEDVEPEEVARLISGGSCAQLEAVLNKAAIYAGYEGETHISRRNILEACISYRSERPLFIEAGDSRLLEKVAIHEAGHLVAAEVLEPGSVNFAYACLTADKPAGFVVCAPGSETEAWERKRNNIIISLASKVATEIIKGVTDTGCRGDLLDAFRAAEHLVDDYCSYGFNAFCMGSDRSQYRLSEKDHMVTAEINRCYQETRKLLSDNRNFLDAVISALKEKNIITYKEIDGIKRRLGE